MAAVSGNSTYSNYFFSVFSCQGDYDCNVKGTCMNETCSCRPGWDEQVDCSRKFLKLNQRLVLEIYNGLLLIYTEFKCYMNEHCNSHGTCNNVTGQCTCDTNWKDSSDCTGNLFKYLPNHFLRLDNFSTPIYGCG